MTRRAKIVCTLGPATSTLERVRALVEAGMDVARLNFSHGTHGDHKRAYDLVREASDQVGRAVGILADLQGPKIRLGRFATGPVEWKTGETVTITTDRIIGTHDRVSTTYDRLAQDVRPGNRLLVDDGKVALDVVDVSPPDVHLVVVEGGLVSDHKGLSLPHVPVSVPALSAKDAEDLRFALGLSVDMIALSFVRSAEDIRLVHLVMTEAGRYLPVIAKVEKPEAVDKMDDIVAAFDGVMVARGDLGVEMPLEQVPLVQKRLVQLARENAKPVIVATQMLDSMIENSRPTRAEASDVANAVLDGADAVMLSGETSVGKYPVQTVKTMASIVEAVEHHGTGCPPIQHTPRTAAGAITTAARDIGHAVGAKALVAFTETGDTARRLARHQSPIPLLAFTPVAAIRSQLTLTWGVETFLTETVETTDEMIQLVDHALLELGRYERGDRIVIVAGSPPRTPGSTNLVRLHRLGDRLGDR